MPDWPIFVRIKCHQIFPTTLHNRCYFKMNRFELIEHLLEKSNLLAHGMAQFF